MNTFLYACERENRIRGLLLLFPYCSTSIIYQYFFVNLPSGKRKARQVLERMVKKRETLQRFKYGEYLYYLGKKSPQWLHMHNVTKFYFDIYFNLQNPQKIIYYKREYEYPFGKADALYYIQLQADGSGIKFFLEMDDETHEFKKIQQYEEYFKSKLWIKEFWADPLKKGVPRFPMVVVVSERKPPDSEIIKVVHLKPGSVVDWVANAF